MIVAHASALGGAVIEIAVGSLFLHAATAKAFRPDAPRWALGLLGAPRGSWTLRGLVGVEVAVGLALCTGWRLDLAVPAAIGLLAMFTGGLLVLRLRGYEGDCGCGAASALLPMPPELRNALLVSALLAVVIVRPETGGPLGGGIRTALAALLFVSVSAASVLLEARGDRVLAERWEV